MNIVSYIENDKNVSMGLLFFSGLLFILAWFNGVSIVEFGLLAGLFSMIYLLLKTLGTYNNLSFLTSKNFLLIALVLSQVFTLLVHTPEKTETVATIEPAVETVVQTAASSAPLDLATINRANEIFQTLNKKYGLRIDELNREKMQARDEMMEHLTPARLLANNGLAEAKNFNRKFRVVALKQHELIKHYLDEKNDRFMKLIANEQTLTGFNQDSIRLQAALLDIEKQIADAADNLVNFVATNNKHITVQNNQFMFDDTQLMTMHNSITVNINNLSQQDTFNSTHIHENETNFAQGIQNLRQKSTV